MTLFSNDVDLEKVVAIERFQILPPGTMAARNTEILGTIGRLAVGLDSKFHSWPWG